MDPDPRVAEANKLFDYIVELVRDGGGDPVLFSTAPSGPDLASLDGVIIPGGGDLDPGLYGEVPSEACYDVNPVQDDLDVASQGSQLMPACRFWASAAGTSC